MTDEPDLPPHLRPEDGPDPEAEAVISALLRLGTGHVPWRITGEKTAEWVAYKWRAALAEGERINAQAAEWRERIDEWESEQTRKPAATMAWAEAHLTRWLAEQHEADPKVMSRKLPSATVGSRKGAEEWTITNPEAFILWAITNGLDECVKMTPALAEIKKALKRDGSAAVLVFGDSDTGEVTARWVAPGVEVGDKPRSYFVRPA